MDGVNRTTALTEDTTEAQDMASATPSGTPQASQGPDEADRPDPAARGRESILPAIAAALFVGKEIRTHAGTKGDTVPAAHPLVADFLTDLPVDSRERWIGRCPEVELVSAHLLYAETTRKGRAAKRPFTLTDARRALKGAKVTLRRIREDGDPEHGTYQPPCRSCAPMLDHFGVAATER